MTINGMGLIVALVGIVLAIAIIVTAIKQRVAALAAIAFIVLAIAGIALPTYGLLKLNGTTYFCIDSDLIYYCPHESPVSRPG